MRVLLAKIAMDLHHATFLSSQGGVECGFHNEGLGENEFGGEALSLLAVEVVEEDLVVGYSTTQPAGPSLDPLGCVVVDMGERLEISERRVWLEVRLLKSRRTCWVDVGWSQAAHGRLR